MADKNVFFFSLSMPLDFYRRIENLIQS